MLGDTLGNSVVYDGAAEIDGLEVGFALGLEVGFDEGFELGLLLGLEEGLELGLEVAENIKLVRDVDSTT